MKINYSVAAVLALFAVLTFTQVSVSLAESPLSASEVRHYKQGKAAGKLVEKGNGYLKPGPGANGALISLMGQVNRLRKEKYQKVAKKTGAPLQAVEMAAGSKLMKKRP